MSSAAGSWPTLETARLQLRRFRADDLMRFVAYRNDPDVARYQSWESITLAEAQAFIQAERDARLGSPGVGVQIAIELRATGELIGDCYFRIEADDPRQAEIGYTLATHAQGQGLATEAVSAWLTYAFGAFDLHRITATVDCQNLRSVALLERLGMRREGHFLQNIWFKGAWGDEYLYAMLREEWPARQNEPAP